MSASAYTTFDTAIGPCWLAWGERGITGVGLPGARPRGARETEPPVEVREALEQIRALLEGEPRDLSALVLDMEGVAPFDRAVYRAARAIGAGETATYGELADRIGSPGQAREVGGAMARNRFPLIVPCHRVVAAGGRLGGFSAPGGPALKRRLLAIEHPPSHDSPTLFELASAT